jgi:DNA-binding NarL/FixJ family response regulator
MALRVMVVEDDETFRGLARRLCRHAGFVVVAEAGTAREALARARDVRPDAVLLDVHLPDAFGPDVAAELTRSTPPPTVLLMSSDGDSISGDDARAAGARGFVAKTDLARTDLASWFGTAVTVRGVSPIRILIAEDQLLLREGLARLLAESGFDVVAQAADATDLLRKVNAHRPDVALVDVQMPPGGEDDGLRAAIEIRAAFPDVGVIVLSQYLEERYALDLIGDDARRVGYLLKDRIGDLASLTDAIQRVARGGSALDPDVVAAMVGRRRRHDPLDALSPRERDVLELMAQGKSNQGIADELVVSLAAIEKHITGIFRALGVGHEPSEHRRVMAVLALLQRS